MMMVVSGVSRGQQISMSGRRVVWPCSEQMMYARDLKGRKRRRYRSSHACRYEKGEAGRYEAVQRVLSPVLERDNLSRGSCTHM